MYESPIEVITREIANDLDRKIGEEVYRSMLKVGVKVDKEELIKALQYDRDQYNKGFNDGVKEFAGQVEEALLNKKLLTRDDIPVIIKNLVKERLGDAE